MKGKHLKRRIETLIAACAVAISGSVLVAVPPASADGLANPSGTLTVSCPGAEAFIQVGWEGPNKVNIWWRIEDTGTAANISPVLRIQAHDEDHNTEPFVFPGDNAYFVLRGGNGTHQDGAKFEWNPSNLADLNHLLASIIRASDVSGLPA